MLYVYSPVCALDREMMCVVFFFYFYYQQLYQHSICESQYGLVCVCVCVYDCEPLQQHDVSLVISEADVIVVTDTE